MKTPRKKNPAPKKTDEEVYRQIYLLLRERNGFDFSNYKQSTIHRRINRRMSMNKISTIHEYSKYLSKHPTEVKALFSDLLIPVTSFFRDPHTCEELSKTIFPALLKKRQRNDSLRIWVAGCSTGEEAYSFAICLLEYLGGKTEGLKLQIFGTDVSETSVSLARKGFFTGQQMKGVSPKRLKQYFTKEEGGYQVRKILRDMCIFAVHNFLLDPPFANMDIISSMNVLIYMDSLLQKTALSTFHYALKEKGYLLLGKSESILSTPDLFTAVSTHSKIYQKKQGKKTPMLHLERAKDGTSLLKRNMVQPLNVTDFSRKAENILLTKYTPPGVIINSHNAVVQFHGNTSAFLFPPHGKASLNFFKMVHEELSYALREGLNKVRKTNKKISLENISFTKLNRDGALKIEIVPLPDEKEEHVLILFEFAARPALRTPKILSAVEGDKKHAYKMQLLENELTQAREDMRSMAEEQEAANEELQSANEELLSSTEELQAMNEELEASHEELQASNQELMTANNELQEREAQLKKTYAMLEDAARNLEDKVEERTKELKQKNEELKSSEERYHKMVQEVRDYAILLLNKDGIVQNWNKGAELLKGYRTEEIVGKNFRIFYTEADKKTNLPQKLIREAEVNGRAVNEGWRVRKDGTKFWGSITITALHDDHDKVIGFSKVTRDLTDKKIAEEQQHAYVESLAKKNKELQESEERYHKMIDEVMDYAIILLDREGNIQNWNRGAEKIKGYKAEEIVGKSFRTFYTPEDRESGLPQSLMGIAVKTGRATTEGWRVRKDGSKFWGSITITALHDDHDNVIGFSKVTRDLTDKKNSEENDQKYLNLLEEKNRELQKSNAELERFSYLASHDLQEPLRKIRTFSNRLQEKFHDLPSDMKIYLDKIEMASARMTSLIKDLLDYSRLSNPEVEFVLTDLNDIIINVLGDFELLVEQKKAKIKTKLLPEIEAIPLQMNQLFHNLIGNALKFSRAEVTPVLQISSRMLPPKELKKYSTLSSDLSYVEILFKDNGIGFHQHHAEQIFSLFKRLHERNQYQGTGIGLSLSKKIVEIHKGFIFAESHEEEGAVFHVILPVHQPTSN